MCRVDAFVYVSADGHRQTFRDFLPCHKPGPGKLCPIVKRRICEYVAAPPVIRTLDDSWSSPVVTPTHTQYTNPRQIPFRHGHYIGHGSQGTVDTVERSSEPPGGKLYARKQFMLSRTPKPMKLDPVLQEIRIASNLQHKHVARLIETYQCKNIYAMIMEPVAEGNFGVFLSDLDDTPENNNNGLREQLSLWFGCLANAIGYLHKNKVYHGDINPQNILTMKGNVLFTGFGISKEFQEKTITWPTETLGTKTYRSPELESGHRPGRREDMFSLGAVFLEMLTVYSGYGQLNRFRDFRGGPYCQNIDNVHEWVVSLSKRHYTIPWYWTMLSTCRIMLEMNRESRPFADDLMRCWNYQPNLAMPPTSCNCFAPWKCREKMTLVQALRRAAGNNNWLPARLLVDKRATIRRMLTAAVNEMTLENLNKTAAQIAGILTQTSYETDGRTLRQALQLTFVKACDEHNRGSVYARFCKEMMTCIPPDVKDENFLDSSGNTVSGAKLFRKYLLNRCQEEFEYGGGDRLTHSTEEGGETAEQSDESATAKRRRLGLILFIGELYNESLLTLRVIHECVIAILKDYGGEGTHGLLNDFVVESLAKLLQTVGATMETTITGPKMLDVYFVRIKQIMSMDSLSSYSKLIIKDTIDMREAGWTSGQVGQRVGDESPLPAS
jgi:tRNA A-37 threonylcarbamoyl transferase component Bud32